MNSFEFVSFVGENHRQIELEINRTFPTEGGARWRAFPGIISSPEEETMDLDRFFDSHKNHAEEVRKEREASARACFLNQGKVPLAMAERFAAMTDEALEKMEELRQLAHSLEDHQFIFAFQETKPNTVGLISWLYPKLFVMDRISVREYKQLVYRDGNFCMVPDSTVEGYQLYDAEDMLTVGKPFAAGGNQYIERTSFDSIKSTIESVAHQKGIENMAEFAIHNIPLHLVDETLQFAKERFKTIRTCRGLECGRQFYISETEAKWYLDKNMKLPGLCRKCRKARRDRIRAEEVEDLRRQLEADYRDFGFY